MKWGIFLPQTRQTVERALDLLNCFTSEHPQWSVGQLAQATGLEKSTISRLLSTLVMKRYLYKDPSQRLYFLGGRILELADTIQTESIVCRMGEGILYDLSEQTGETILLGLRRGYSCQFVKIIEGQQNLRVGPRLGATTPLHAGAIGKAILAYLPEQEIKQYIGKGLGQVTPKTVVDPAILLEELASVRKQGYAASFGEIESDVVAIAAPVFDYSGRVNVSVCMDMPFLRFTTIEKYAEPICRAADSLGLLLKAR